MGFHQNTVTILFARLTDSSESQTTVVMLKDLPFFIVLCFLFIFNVCTLNFKRVLTDLDF